MNFPDNGNVLDFTEQNDKSDYCGRAGYNDGFAYGIYANQGYGSDISEEEQVINSFNYVANAYFQGRRFKTYNCKYCNSEVRIVNTHFNVIYPGNTAKPVGGISSYMREQYPNDLVSWVAQDNTSSLDMCLECRSGCFQYCHDGCFAVCAQGLKGCRTGNS